MSTAATTRQFEPECWRVNDFALAHGISRSTVYELIREGRIRAIKIGGRTVIPQSESRRLVSEAEAA